MLGLKPQEIESIRRVFAGHPQILRGVVFGSRAKGNFKPFSDIDISIVTNGLDHHRFISILSELDDLLLPYEIDLLEYDSITNVDLKDHIDRVGVEIYSRAPHPDTKQK